MNTQYIFVHGLAGWGEYDPQYRLFPYWGMACGDLMRALRKKGYACHAASVSPTGSAWDRACELYAQLSGTRTDYGLAHAKRANHARFGPDFTGRALIPEFDENTRLVLLGHSFGGATVRLFSAFLSRGDQTERSETAPNDLSPLFRGGMGARVRAIVTLAAPHNGTTAYDLHDDPDFDPEKVRVSVLESLLAKTVTGGTRAKDDGRASFDWASYDMHITGALRLNEKLPTQADVYYFSVLCSASVADKDGVFHPNRRAMEKHIVKSSAQMGLYAGKTRGGFPLGSQWRENDGLVNTFSARAPLFAPQTDFVPGKIRPGVWNVMPVYPGDHMSLQGGLAHVRNVRPFYEALLAMLKDLPE